MTTIPKVAATLAVLALLGGIGAWWAGGYGTLINFVAGFLSAALVLAASGFGYWQMVQGSAESSPHHDLPDETERIDDRFGLWEDDVSESASYDAKRLLKEERDRLKKGRRDFKTFLKTTKPALSLYRFGAYAVLVYVVYRLITAEAFDPIFYLLGAGTAPLGTAAVLWFLNR